MRDEAGKVVKQAGALQDTEKGKKNDPRDDVAVKDQGLVSWSQEWGQTMLL